MKVLAPVNDLRCGVCTAVLSHLSERLNPEGIYVMRVQCINRECAQYRKIGVIPWGASEIPEELPQPAVRAVGATDRVAVDAGDASRGDN